MAVDLSRTARQPRLTSTTRQVAAADPIEAFAAARHAETRALWLRPATGEAFVAVGSACTLTRDAAAVWRQLAAEAESRAPMLVGGFTFDMQAPASALWRGFGPERFVLPERVWQMQNGVSTLTTNTVKGVPNAPGLEPERISRTARAGLNPDEWRTLVGEVAAEIREGHLGLRKVVLARTQQVHMQVPVEAALRRLAETYPSCTVFAFASGAACFLGATPERLVALHNGTATTMALAGSGPRGATPEVDASLARRLLHDAKERTEHAVVVDALREDLAPFSARVIAAAEPRIHTLPNLHHLITPIRAQVRPGCSVLDLVSRLHPTPAVGGYPRESAMALIREREELDRGWYAAPLGWVDAHGQGEFVVALRSALVRDGTATLFAGCGIVGDSDPETENAELGWKLRPMLTALGVTA
jgi:menaquinone-specific isochorismate synthase